MRTTVVRDGQELEIKARELVPGDIVSLFSLFAFN
jgi:magnesium-transporting ATPase (P-type)